MHHLAFDFATGANALVSGDWVMESKSTLRKTTTMTLPTKPDASGLVFTLLEIQFYNYTEGSYVPMVEDRSKSVVIVEVI